MQEEEKIGGSPAPRVLALRKDIFSYVRENKDFLSSRLEEIEGWSETYSYLSYEEKDEIDRFFEEVNGQIHEEDQVIGILSVESREKGIVEDPTIVNFFKESQLIHAIDYPENSDVIQFYVDGFGIVSSGISLGFYYTPDDRPKWIDADRWDSGTHGKYMNWPMLPEVDGWVQDNSLISAENDPYYLQSYNVYTERICENFYYYESNY